MQPHDRTPNIKQPSVQSVPFSQVDCCHPNPFPPIVTLIIRLDGLFPEVPNASIAVFSKANVDQKITEAILRFEIRSWLGGGPGFD